MISIKCPDCGHKFDESEFMTGTKFIFGEDDYGRVECPRDDCGGEFYLACKYTVEYLPCDDRGRVF